MTIAVMALIHSCRKDKAGPPVEHPAASTELACNANCEDIPPGPEVGWTYQSTGPQFLTPCFNPNNSNEFVFLRRGTASVAELVKYNLSSNSEEVLCNSIPIATPPQWGDSGWITFSTIGWEVWKIKEDGSQLTQLTHGAKDLFPYFSSTGQEIYYFRAKSYNNSELSQNPDLYYEYLMMKIDLQGTKIDSVTALDIIPNNYYQTWQVASFQDDKVYFIGGIDNYYGLYSLDLITESTNTVFTWNTTPQNYFAQDIDYFNGELFFTKFRRGLYKVGDMGGTEIEIRNGCGMKYYKDFSISNDGAKLIAEVVISDYSLELGFIEEQHDIYLIDLASCEETIILDGE